MDLDKQEKIKNRFKLVHKSGVLPWKMHDPSPALNRFFDLVEEEVGQGAKILDIGCGDGWISIKAAELGFQVWGIDSSPEAIANAQKSAKEAGVQEKTDFQVGDALKLPYGAEFFQGAIDRGLFHHILPENRRLYLENLLKVLQPRSIFYLSVFSRENPFGIGQRFTEKGIRSIFSPQFEVLELSEDKAKFPAHLYHLILKRK